MKYSFIAVYVFAFLVYAVIDASAGIFGSHVVAYSAPVRVEKSKPISHVKSKTVKLKEKLACAEPEAEESSGAGVEESSSMDSDG